MLPPSASSASGANAGHQGPTEPPPRVHRSQQRHLKGKGPCPPIPTSRGAPTDTVSRSPSGRGGEPTRAGSRGRHRARTCLFSDPPSPAQPGSENAADTRHRVGPGSSRAPTPARQAPDPSTPRPRSCTRVWHGPSVCFIFANGSHPFVPVQDTVCARSQHRHVGHALGTGFGPHSLQDEVVALRPGA